MFSGRTNELTETKVGHRKLCEGMTKPRIKQNIDPGRHAKHLRQVLINYRQIRLKKAKQLSRIKETAHDQKLGISIEIY